MQTVHIIGGGLAGSEAALQLAYRGIPVHLHEMRPTMGTDVHVTGSLAELVCSNSLKSTNIDSAAGLLKYELSCLGSFLLEMAFECRVPAGGALALDRRRFSSLVEEAVRTSGSIEVTRDEVRTLEPYLEQGAPVIVAAGPLVSEALAADIAALLGCDGLAFFDAAAPIVEADSLDMDLLFAQSRHGRGGRADYLNAALDRAGYDALIGELIAAKRVIARDFESSDLFSACQPVEQVALSGHDALRFGALKPIGLVDPATGHRPWAAVQLRAENGEMSAYNLVGFQTNLTFSEQDRIFRMIPGLEHAEFSRHGVMHRNTFIDSPHALGPSFELPTAPTVRFAGQICGTEGYCEAIASGLMAALCTYADLASCEHPRLPKTTASGSLMAYATDPACQDYQPMHANFGIIEPLSGHIRGKRERYHAYSVRAQSDLASYLASRPELSLHPWTGPDLIEVSKADGRQEG